MLVRQQEATQALNYAALLGTLLTVVQPAVGALATAATAAVQLQYQREFEQEADYMGARYLQSAGYDPRAMLDFFKQLSDDDAHRLGRLAPPYLQSHPVTDERLNHLEAVLKTQQWAPRDARPPSFALRRAQALARVRSEPPGDVVKAYRRALEEDPADPMAQYLFGVVCLETGQLDVGGPALAAARAGGVDAADRELGCLALRQRDAREGARSARRLRGARAERRRRARRARQGAGSARRSRRRRWRSTSAPSRWRRSSRARITASACWPAAPASEGDGFYHLATAARLGGDYATALNQYSRAAPRCRPAIPRRRITPVDRRAERLPARAGAGAAAEKRDQ